MQANPFIPQEDAVIWKTDASLRLEAQLVASQVSDTLFSPQTLILPASIESARRLLDGALEVSEAVKVWFELRKDTTHDQPQAPRMIRLARRLDLTGYEQAVLNFLVTLTARPALAKRFSIN